MKTNFMDKTANIMEEVLARTCIGNVDAEIIEELLQKALDELAGYYEEECYVAIASARSRAYDDGHSDGYSDGYDEGYAAASKK